MTTTTSKLEAFFLCQKQSRGDLGKTLVADQIANAGPVGFVADDSEFQFPRMGQDDLNALIVWRYNRDGNDEVKRIDTVEVETARALMESAWGNDTDLDYVLMGIQPYKVLDAMDAGYARMQIRKDVVLTIGSSDLDMERDDAFFWNQYLTNCAVSKEEALPENKVTGDWALKITLSAANGKLLGPAIRAVPGDKLTVAACLRVVGGGPFTVRLWDQTHGAYFGDTQSYSGAEFAYLFIRDAAVPAGCNYWQIEIKGTDNGAIAWLDSVSARAAGDTTFKLESWIDERYKVPLIHRMKFKSAIEGVANQYAATKKYNAGDLVLGTHYQAQIMHTEANRYMLELEDGTDLGDDIFYLATRRDRKDVEPWAAKTDTTTAPRGELIAYLMYEVSSLLFKETGDPYWQQQHDEWGQRLGEEVKPRAEQPYVPPRETIVIKAGTGSW